MIRSPSIYSTASNSSLHGVHGGIGGAWRMFVPDVGSALDDLEIDDMLLDPSALESKAVGSIEVLLLGYYIDEDADTGVETFEARSGEPPHNTQVSKMTSTYKKATLLQLNLVQETQGEGGHLKKEGSGKGIMADVRVREEAVEDTLTQQVAFKGGVEMGSRNDMSPEKSLLSEIDKVMVRVEEALVSLEDNEGKKKVRRTTESSTSEVRTLVKNIEQDEEIEGISLSDDKVVLFVSSETSGDSGEKKRKRKQGLGRRAEVWHQD